MGSHPVESRRVNCLTLVQLRRALKKAIVDARELPQFESSLRRSRLFAARSCVKPTQSLATHCLLELIACRWPDGRRAAASIEPLRSCVSAPGVRMDRLGISVGGSARPRIRPAEPKQSHLAAVAYQTWYEQKNNDRHLGTPPHFFSSPLSCAKVAPRLPSRERGK